MGRLRIINEAEAEVPAHPAQIGEAASQLQEERLNERQDVNANGTDANT